MASVGSIRHLDRRGDRKAGRGWRATVRRRLRQAARRGGAQARGASRREARRPRHQTPCRAGEAGRGLARSRGGTTATCAGSGRATRDLWTGADEAKWLGWLNIVEEQRKRIDAACEAWPRTSASRGSRTFSCSAWADRASGRRCLPRRLAGKQGVPELLVLDSTDPAQIRTIESKIDPARTLFIVSSKSGSTLEPNILKQYFFERAKSGRRRRASGITVHRHHRSRLEAAEGRRTRSVPPHRVWQARASAGAIRCCRISAWCRRPRWGSTSSRLLDATQMMVRSCGPDVPPADNPGVVLGTILGDARQSRAATRSRIVASPGIADFGAWLEQLLAESTGKQGKGLIPVDAEPLGPPDVYGQDRVVRLHAADERGGCRAG